jgi:hypothetical protein
LGFTFKEGENLVTKGRYSVHEKVDILIEGNGKVDFNAAIGFKKQADGTYTAVGDFYGLRTADGTSVDASMLKCEVTASAKEAEIVERLSQMGFTVDTSDSCENKKEIVVSMERWV